MDTAVRASSLILETKILSTTLYNALIVIDNIAGNAMLIKSFLMGMVPILLSCNSIFSSIQLPLFLLMNKYYITNYLQIQLL